MQTPGRWLALATIPLALGADVASAARSDATITASFADSCRDVVVSSTKDISHVVLHYADGRRVKDETASGHEYALDGALGDELSGVDVKSGQTLQSFGCQANAQPPVAVLESRVCQLTLECAPFLPDDSPGEVGTCSHFEESIPFRGINSTDPDGDIVSWSIDFGDGSPPASGSWATNPPIDVRHVYGTPPASMLTTTLTLTDAAGLVGTDTLIICVIDQRPD